jgi:hypothetical protein
VGDSGIGLAATLTPKRRRRSARSLNPAQHTRRRSSVSQCANLIETASLRQSAFCGGDPAEP